MSDPWRIPDRWNSREEAEGAATAFLSAAFKLIVRSKDADEWAEAERLGMRLATRLQMTFQAVPDGSIVSTLRKALDAFDEPPTQMLVRAWCARAIAEWATKWRSQEWQATEESRSLLLRQLVNELCLHDSAFEELRQDSAFLAERLEAFKATPPRKPGERSPERILAEVILRLSADKVIGFQQNLDLAVEDATEDIRKRLAKAVSEVFK